jgi:hypothetical protein
VALSLYKKIGYAQVDRWVAAAGHFRLPTSKPPIQSTQPVLRQRRGGTGSEVVAGTSDDAKRSCRAPYDLALNRRLATASRSGTASFVVLDTVGRFRNNPRADAPTRD